jgi:hypothetical protein
VIQKLDDSEKYEEHLKERKEEKSAVISRSCYRTKILIEQSAHGGITPCGEKPKRRRKKVSSTYLHVSIQS